MNISNYYWYFKSALTPRFCDEVIKYANNQKEVMARTGGYGDRKLKKHDVWGGRSPPMPGARCRSYYSS